MIKVIAFDVYRTILCSEDPENCMGPRTGFLEFSEKCIFKGVRLVTSSDNQLWHTKNDLNESGVPLGLFTDHYQMEKSQPKYFGFIIDFFAILPEELYVFGDRLDYDIEPALDQGCQATLVPPYVSVLDTFDFMSLWPLIDNLT
jgi:FMN phosphatase YigB (HAD superfamily)